MKFDDLGPSIKPTSQVQHPLREFGIIDPIIDLFKSISDLHPFRVEFQHVLVVLQRDHVTSELYVEFLLRVLVTILLEEISLDAFEEEVYLQVFHESAIVEFSDKWIFLLEVGHASLAAHHA